MSFHVTSFAAESGDCYLCEIPIGGRTYRILIDGGTPGSAKETIARLKAGNSCPQIDLLVVTHIDSDHIGGILKLLEDADINSAVKEIWFNGHSKLPVPAGNLQNYSVTQGVELENFLMNDARWNTSLDHGPVCLEADGSPRLIRLLGDEVTIHVLSPGLAQLESLRLNWEKALVEPVAESPRRKSRIQRFGAIGKDVVDLANRRFEKDTAYANGSSIAFLLTANGKRALFTGDAFADVICDSAENIDAKPIPIDVFKVSHHGSAKNTDARIVQKFPAHRYLISTDGSHNHPDEESLARILVHSPNKKAIYFNYPHVLDGWEGVDFEGDWKCTMHFGDGKLPLSVDFSKEAT